MGLIGLVAELIVLACCLAASKFLKKIRREAFFCRGAVGFRSFRHALILYLTFLTFTTSLRLFVCGLQS